MELKIKELSTANLCVSASLREIVHFFTRSYAMGYDLSPRTGLRNGSLHVATSSTNFFYMTQDDFATQIVRNQIALPEEDSVAMRIVPTPTGLTTKGIEFDERYKL